MRIQGTRRSPRRRGAAASSDLPQSPLPAGLTGGALAPRGAGKALRITDVQTTEALRGVVAASLQLGIPVPPRPLGADAPEEVYRMEIDEEAPGIAQELAQGLKEQPKVAERSGVRDVVLAGLREQHREMAAVRGDAAALDEGVARARRVFGAVQQKVGDRLEAALDWVLKQPDLDPKKRDRLQSYQKRLQVHKERVQAEQQAQAQKTRAATAAGKAQIDQARRQVEAVQTWADARAGRPVDDAAAAEATEVLGERRAEDR